MYLSDPSLVPRGGRRGGRRGDGGREVENVRVLPLFFLYIKKKRIFAILKVMV